MVTLNRITTRAGDDGHSALADGSRLPKDHARFEALGGVDLLGCQLGVVRSLAVPGGVLARLLLLLQNELYDLGADLAYASPVGKPDLPTLRVTGAQVEGLERVQAFFQKDMPPLTSFVLPGAQHLEALLQVTRATCRCAERQVARLLHDQDSWVNPLALVYLNRLADLLFVLARWVLLRHDADSAGSLWVPGATTQGGITLAALGIE